ncbi:MAG TPA: bifunctional oligoribonuclease/PAP phosphatase NrnA [Candidatus Bipolaricaulota bacterium]|nr:bifunctional oligoribonuclease/PAP phosphatase NrnA [Candidatus Bipolaricaulota bacterium]
MKILEKKILDKIDESRDVLIVCHRNPDADTIGAAAAFFYHCQTKKKNVVCFCADLTPESLKETRLVLINSILENELNKFQTIVCLDCGEIKQTGIADLIMNRDKTSTLINIDHHFTNNNYGDINIVKPESSSTSEIVYRLFKNNLIKLDKGSLNSLLTGIISDTTFFSNAATTQASMEISSELMSRGARIKAALQSLWKNKNFKTLKFWGRVFSGLKYNEKYKIAFAAVTEKDLADNFVDDDSVNGIANFLMNLYQPNIIVVLRETGEGKIKGSIRTTKDNIDVSKLAMALGGGGHRRASGFTLDGKIIKEDGHWRVV